jgi:hypothetical protein
MPRGKQLHVVEKTKILTWFLKGVTTTSRLTRKVSVVRRIIRDNKTLLPAATPPCPKKWSGRPSAATFREEERLHCYVLWYPFKTARERKKEIIGWLIICQDNSEDLPEEAGFAVPLHREEAAVDCQDGKKEDGLLQKVHLVD